MAVPHPIYHNRANPNAKIGFVVAYPFHFYVYKNVYKHLADEAEFIVDMGGAYPVEQPPHIAESTMRLLEKYKVSFSILKPEDYRNESYLNNFFHKYEALVSLAIRGCPSLKCNEDKKHIHLIYSLAKELGVFALWKRRYDLILSYGKYDHDIFSLYALSEIVGNPKLDDWFNNEFDDGFLSEIRRRIDPLKKTILYLPTHGDLSSIPQLTPELKKINSRFNIIAKLHHFTAFEPEKIDALASSDIVVFWDDIDLLSLLKLADVVITDSSGAFFDAALADKPIIVTDFLSEGFFNGEHKTFRMSRRGKLRPLSYADSIEQRIKRQDLTRVIRNAESLTSEIENVFSSGDSTFRGKREEMCKELFAFNDGRCGERAAHAIKKLLSNPVRPKKPILFHLIESFEHELSWSILQRKNTAS